MHFFVSHSSYWLSPRPLHRWCHQSVSRVRRGHLPTTCFSGGYSQWKHIQLPRNGFIVIGFVYLKYWVHFQDNCFDCPSELGRTGGPGATTSFQCSMLIYISSCPIYLSFLSSNKIEPPGAWGLKSSNFVEIRPFEGSMEFYFILAILVSKINQYQISFNRIKSWNLWFGSRTLYHNWN